MIISIIVNLRNKILLEKIPKSLIKEILLLQLEIVS